jgi:hypothetical protein
VLDEYSSDERSGRKWRRINKVGGWRVERRWSGDGEKMDTEWKDNADRQRQIEHMDVVPIIPFRGLCALGRPMAFEHVVVIKDLHLIIFLNTVIGKVGIACTHPPSSLDVEVEHLDLCALRI